MINDLPRNNFKHAIQNGQKQIGDGPVLILSTFWGVKLTCGRRRRRKNTKQKIGVSPALF